MKYKGIRVCVIVVFIQIQTQLTHAETTLKQENDDCGQTLFEDCGECADGLECIGAGDPGMMGLPECGACQKIKGKIRRFC